MKQNIFNNDAFFAGYRDLRNRKINANVLEEKPALFSLLPDLTGARVLDLGCGFGENCAEFVRMGAAQVVGIDLSCKMLEVARAEVRDEKITFFEMAMEDIAQIEGTFDLVVSSLAMHYIRDFAALVKDIHALLKPSGCFVFSQEHPVNTCFTQGSRWVEDAHGNRTGARLCDYNYDHPTESSWFVDGIVRYHRKMSTILNTLIRLGFRLDQIAEPLPDEAIRRQYPQFADDIHKPNFLLLRATRE